MQIERLLNNDKEKKNEEKKNEEKKNEEKKKEEKSKIVKKKRTLSSLKSTEEKLEIRKKRLATE